MDTLFQLMIYPGMEGNTPEEYHAVLEQEWSNSISNYDNSDENACVDSKNDKNASVIEDDTNNTALKAREQMVVIDVRNLFEYAIGHFVHSSPLTNENDSYSDEIDGENQVKKETINSSFDKSFCEKNAESLKDKKVLMYCTGGIRCEKANAILRKRGVEDVSQLSGVYVVIWINLEAAGFLKEKISSLTNALP